MAPGRRVRWHRKIEPSAAGESLSTSASWLGLRGMGGAETFGSRRLHDCYRRQTRSNEQTARLNETGTKIPHSQPCRPAIALHQGRVKDYGRNRHAKEKIGD
jgi:hypothetical protein